MTRKDVYVIGVLFVVILSLCGVTPARSSEENTVVSDKEKEVYPSSVQSTFIHLMTPRWDQGDFYNDVIMHHNGNMFVTFPISGWRSEVVTGCTATAIAIKLRYHEWPQRGFDAHSYDDPAADPHEMCSGIPGDCVMAPGVGFSHSRNFGDQVYQWDTMPVTPLTSANSPEEILAVANLMYDCGVAVEMNYEIGGSSAGFLKDNISRYFSYLGAEYVGATTVLFDIYTEFQDELDELFLGPDNRNCTDDDLPIVYDVHEEIRRVFQENNSELSQDLVCVKERCTRWIIIDNGKDIIYILDLMGDVDMIRVYQFLERETLEIIKMNLQAGLPVLASSLSHSMVIEGYRDDTADPLICVNHGHGAGEPWGYWGRLFHTDDGEWNDGPDGIHQTQDDIIPHWIISLVAYCQPTNYVYVDPNYNGVGKGLLKEPYTTFKEGYNAVPTKGHLWLKGGSYTIAPFTLTKEMTIHPHYCDDPVVLPKYEARPSVFFDFLENYPRLFPLLRQILNVQ